MNKSFRAAGVAISLASVGAVADAQIIRGQFTVATFNLQNFSTLQVERLNNRGQIVGSFDTASGASTEVRSQLRGDVEDRMDVVHETSLTAFRSKIVLCLKVFSGN